MTRPGINITTRESAPTTSIPTDTGVGFMVGVTEKGPLAPVAVHNMTEYEATYGLRVSFAITTYDSAETFFKEGGYTLYVGRVVGPAAAVATVSVTDVGALATLTANAKGPGAYGNDLNVVIRTNAQDATIPVGSWRARIQTDAAVVLEESYDLLDDAAGVYWSQTVSKWVTFVDAAASANDPNAGATFALAGGADDTAGITDTQWLAGIARFTADFGPGQVFAPGRVTAAGQIQLANHALTFNRIALLDGPDTPTVATLTALPAAIIDSSVKRSRYSGLFAPWIRIPGLTVGTVRTIPPSAAVAGLIARNDAPGFTQNQPSAGEKGIFMTAIALSQPSWTDAERQTMNSAGVNVIRDMFGVRKVYGYRTVADPVNDSRWINLSNSRLHRAVAALANAVGERYIFRQIDGEGRLINEFGGVLIGEVCLPFYNAGALYGATPGEAFKVDVGPSVNTAATIANNELHAVIQLRMSPFGEEIDIEIVKLLVTETIAA